MFGERNDSVLLFFFAIFVREEEIDTRGSVYLRNRMKFRVDIVFCKCYYVEVPEMRHDFKSFEVNNMPLETLKSADRVTGLKQVGKAVKNHRAVRVFLADDADAHVTEPIRELCKAEDIPVEAAPTMKELGKACGIDVGAAAAALIGSHR